MSTHQRQKRFFIVSILLLLLNLLLFPATYAFKNIDENTIPDETTGVYGANKSINIDISDDSINNIIDTTGIPGINNKINLNDIDDEDLNNTDIKENETDTSNE